MTQETTTVIIKVPQTTVVGVTHADQTHVSTPQTTAVITKTLSTPIVVNNATRQAIVAGQTGLPGPAGPSGALSESRVATTDLGGHRIVRVVPGGSVNYASATDPAHGDDTLGITLHAASAGQPVNVKRSGAVTFTGWTWAPGEPVFLAANGLLASAPDETAAFGQIIGFAESADTVFIDIQPPVYF